MSLVKMTILWKIWMNGAEGEVTKDLATEDLATGDQATGDQATGVSGSGNVPVVDKKEMKLERLENAVRKLTINKEKSIDHERVFK